jgi:hypothetical protein
MLVTPKGDVKALELRLFEEPIEINIEDILDDDRFTSIQKEKYDSLNKSSPEDDSKRGRPPSASKSEQERSDQEKCVPMDVLLMESILTMEVAQKIT